MKLAFTDVETTGLDPDRHDIWEVGIIVRDNTPMSNPYADDGPLQPNPGTIWTPPEPADVEHRMFIRPDLSSADGGALRVSRYYQRTAHLEPAPWDAGQVLDGVVDAWCNPRDVAIRVATLTAGAHLVGANPSFDAAFLGALLKKHGLAPAWNHRLIDVEALVAGAVRWELPKSLTDSAEWLGVPVDPDAKHTALGDARVARDIYDAIIAPRGGAADKQAKTEAARFHTGGRVGGASV